MSTATADLPVEIARRLGLEAGMVTTISLALDGSDSLLAVWTTTGTPGLEAVADLAAHLGGQVLDGEEDSRAIPGVSRTRARGATPRGSSPR